MAILTISREFGSGGRDIAQAVAEKLGYELLDRDKFLKELGTRGKNWENWGKGLDEHSPSTWEKYDWSFRGFSALARSVLLAHAYKDNTVLMERGANFLLRGVPHAFRIRVIAPFDFRVEKIMVRESVDYDTARWLIERTDYERSRFIYALIGKEWDSPSDYDAVFNTGIQPIDEVILMVCETLNHRNELKTAEAEKNLELQAVAARIEAGLFTYPFLFVNTVEVTVDSGTLILKGVVRDFKQKKKVEDAALELAGDFPLNFDLHYRL
jgi:cytidylate kinase